MGKARQLKAQRKAEREAEPTHALVQTFGGNTLLPVDAEVWVKVGLHAVRKKVRDLRENDKVLEHNTTVKASLAEIKKVLLSEDRAYAAAHRQLHDSAYEGDVTRLQSFLAHVNGVDPEDFQDSSVRKAAVDAVAKRLEEVDEKLHRRIGSEPDFFQRQRQTITEWLTGQTTLPYDKTVLQALRKFDRQKFDELFGRPTGGNPNPESRFTITRWRGRTSLGTPCTRSCAGGSRLFRRKP